MPILDIGFYIDNYITAIVAGKLKRESTKNGFPFLILRWLLDKISYKLQGK
jgi:hypothetical protein